MAIKVSGTTVVDDSRNFKNIGNINTTGNVYANTFIGDGSQLTNLPAGGSSVEMTASGNLSDGSKVVVNSDGTVSVAGPATAVSRSIGSSTEYESGLPSHITAVYDSVNSKVVISYRDDYNNNYGTSVVGTVSGTSISFGTPVVFQSGSVDSLESVFHETAGKVVIVGRQLWFSNYSAYWVGTVSGTSISFGSYSFIDSNIPAGQSIDIAYDSYDDLIWYAGRNSSMIGKVRSGTLSGTYISWSSETQFSTSTVTSPVSISYDTDAQRAVIGYGAAENSDYFTAVTAAKGSSAPTVGTPTVLSSVAVSYGHRMDAIYIPRYGRTVFSVILGNYPYLVSATVSGTSISLNNVLFLHGVNINRMDISFHDEADRIYLTWKSTTNKAYAEAYQLNSSGTISRVESAVQLYTGSYQLNEYIAHAYHRDSGRLVVAYVNTGLGKGEALVYQPTHNPVNFTTENYIGISDGSYTNGTTANIQLVGSVDDAQSSLTAGESYYLQRNGTLATTADYPSVYVGRALSATQLEIKA